VKQRANESETTLIAYQVFFKWKTFGQNR